MELTLKNLDWERKRAMKEQTPMKIQYCKVCEEIKPAEEFSKTGRRHKICRECGHRELKRLRDEGVLDQNSITRRYHHIKDRCKGNLPMMSLREFRLWYEREAEDGVCFYCGSALVFEGGPTLQTASVDRIDNSKGYTQDNMVLCCQRCNVIKGSWFTFEEMLEIGEKYLKGRPRVEQNEGRTQGGEKWE